MWYYSHCFIWTMTSPQFQIQFGINDAARIQMSPSSALQLGYHIIRPFPLRLAQRKTRATTPRWDGWYFPSLQWILVNLIIDIVRSVFLNWIERLKQVIDTNGDYIWLQ
jgi:hypothetical protein